MLSTVRSRRIESLIRSTAGRSSNRPRREMLLTRLALSATLAAAAIFVGHTVGSIVGDAEAGNHESLLARVAFLCVALFMLYGNALYQVTRLGYLGRRHRPWAAPGRLRALHSNAPVAILVPSYKEEPRVVRQTLLSAALQDHPNKRIILLLDDPPSPRSLGDIESLRATRRMVGELRATLEVEARRCRAASTSFRERTDGGRFDPGGETARLAQRLREVVSWLRGEAARYGPDDHHEVLLVREVLEKRIWAHTREVLNLERSLRGERPYPSREEIGRAYARIGGLFGVEIASFERKRYANLSQESNKAANLNSYIGLIGKSLREVRYGGHLRLNECDPADAELTVPPAEYVVTLDADSILLPEYVSTLIRFMEAPSNERIAVIQTPYSAVPGAPGRLERLAGATTDIQYLIHQGFTSYDATFWVGANALIRKAALDDIAHVERERGFEITGYIRDRTVIEDTESTVDLIERGWRLHNYPARLAYSATPPDFGALLIQRRRWANGGLLILPRLLSYLSRGPISWCKLAEGFMRIHYLTSIAGVSAGLLLLLTIPVEDDTAALWLAIASLPYYSLYARDLSSSGYRRSDIFRVYALNLMLVPVNLGGVLKSLLQGWTGRKIPFGRTPKVGTRTGAPAGYVLAEYGLLSYCAVAAIVDVAAGRYVHALFSAANASFFAYALIQLIGLRESVEDLAAGLGRLGGWGERDSGRLTPGPSHPEPDALGADRRAA